jgi:hypothetical protein
VRRRPTGTVAAAVVSVLLVGGAAMAACSLTPASPPSTSSTGAPSASGTSSTLVPQTAHTTEFYSPTKNISCELDSGDGPSALSAALCLTLTPARSATLTTDGTVALCTGAQCLSNAGVDTPTLPYGTSITLAPFTCLSTRAAMRCTLASGAGFAISISGVAALGTATLSTTTTTAS